MNILVINGPNLNLLGTREPEVYGTMTLTDMNNRIEEYAEAMEGMDGRMYFVQSNHEGVLIDAIHNARGFVDGIIINPGAYTHYSYAIRDAISGVGIPTAEVHLSNIYEREAFRRVSVIKDVCQWQICGKGYQGYLEALELLVQTLR